MSAWQSAWGDLDLRRGALPRSPGIHLSGIIRPLAIHLKCFDEEDEGLDSLIARLGSEGTVGGGSSDVLCRIAAGLAFEDWIVKQIPGLKYHPGERCVDGIYMTPDAKESINVAYVCSSCGTSMDERQREYDLDCRCGGSWSSKGTPVIHEFKLTWRSAAKPPPVYWDWQSASYCRAEGATRAVLHAYHVNGDYKTGRRPMYIKHTRDWEPGEMDGIWRMIVGHKHLAVPEPGQ